jgi:hypothetical protein
MDVNFKNDHEEYTELKRLIFVSVSDLLQFVKENKSDEISISLLSRRSDNDDGNYAVSDVIEIKIGEDLNGTRGYLCVCNNNRTYYDSFADVTIDNH